MFVSLTRLELLSVLKCIESFISPVANRCIKATQGVSLCRRSRREIAKLTNGGISNTSSHFHGEPCYSAAQIKACAANGKHVFCEKPIATDVPETIEAINACSQAGVKLMTALQRRFDPNFARVKIAIADGEVGDLIQVRACFTITFPSECEIDVLMGKYLSRPPCRSSTRHWRCWCYLHSRTTVRVPSLGLLL